jgi:hypothetical protein
MGRISQLISSRRARRLGVTALAGTALLAFVGCTTAPVPPVSISGGPPTPVTQKGTLTDLGRDLRSYTKLAGDQVVVLPNGTYTAGTVSAPHNATNGIDKGWLVLEAQSPGGVTVNLANTGLTLDASTSRILFVGFKFVNGPIFTYGTDIAFWYTDHSYPATTWAAQGYKFNSNDTMHAYATTSKGISLYGSDLHDAGDAIDVSNSTGTHLEGVNIWNLTDGGSKLDPQDHVHPDAIDATTGNVTNLSVSYSWIRGDIMVQDGATAKTSGGPDTGLVFSHTWVSNSPSAGFQFNSSRTTTPRGIFGQLNDVRMFSEHSGYGRIDRVDGKMYYSPNQVPSRVNVTETQVSNSAPSTDAATLNAESPAQQWRAAHPYDSWIYAIH